MDNGMLMTPELLKRTSAFLITTLCLALIVALYLPGIDTIWLYHEETRRALVAREMMENATWLTPTINQQAYWAKPPLFNWSIILSSIFTDGQITELTARLPSLLSTLALTILLWLFTRQYFHYRLQVWLLLMVLFTPELTRKATSAELDTVFTVLVNLSLFSWFYFWQKQQSKRAWIVSMMLIGLAYLCKREAALLCYFLTILGFLVYSKQWRSINKAEFFTALFIPLLCAAIWWLPMLIQFGLNASIELNQAEVAARQHQGNNVNYLTSVFSYPFMVAVALLPASLLLPLLFIQTYRQYLQTHYGHLYYFCLIATFSNLVPIMLIGDSNVRYFLPMFIPALLLATMLLDAGQTIELKSQQEKRDWARIYLKGLSRTIPLIFYSAIIIGCAVLVTMAGVSTQSNLGLIAVSVIVMFLLIRKTRQRLLPNTIEQAKSFAIFSMVLVICIRLVDISYSLPYRQQSLEKYRNIEAMLIQINQIRNDMEWRSKTSGIEQRISIYGDHKLSHGLYFYDETHLITAVNCTTFENKNPALWLFIESKDVQLAISADDTLLAQFPYTKKYRLHLIATTKPSQYCQTK
ncbi:hypothetical protein FE810_08895 [Thalassotalea litorea]|uniref:Glycosyltransferase RgtA/B/C/D-like domain-containing protein n=1 Tax=Thalassotalea litorea TaxID=2020715 RepID=A0A5R9ILQ6_9GAMM|nr:glycosyltransferase family 39 protein [Thalassotalea litorea]TLU65393.1 hypothetical protein FE810_08895 [Thalassotalea litorea]